MIPRCFFCATQHDVREREDTVDLCDACLRMDRFQILLIQQLSFIHMTLEQMYDAMTRGHELFPVVPETQEG